MNRRKRSYGNSFTRHVLSVVSAKKQDANFSFVVHWESILPGRGLNQGKPILTLGGVDAVGGPLDQMVDCVRSACAV